MDSLILFDAMSALLFAASPDRVFCRDRFPAFLMRWFLVAAAMPLVLLGA